MSNPLIAVTTNFIQLTSCRLEFGSVIYVEVGKKPSEKKSVELHRGVLNRYSTYFKSLIVRRKSRSILELPNVSRDLFKVVHQWKYSGVL